MFTNSNQQSTGRPRLGRRDLESFDPVGDRTSDEPRLDAPAAVGQVVAGGRTAAEVAAVYAMTRPSQRRRFRRSVKGLL